MSSARAPWSYNQRRTVLNHPTNLRPPKYLASFKSPFRAEILAGSGTIRRVYTPAPSRAMADPSQANAMPPELIAFAGKLFDAARQGQMDIFEQAIPRGVPVNLTNDKGDSLVWFTISVLRLPFFRVHLTIL
jgi:hypothetical protein